MNEFELPPSEPLWLKMAKQVYEQPLILMLLASSVVSALFGSYDDAICVLVAVGIVLTGTSPIYHLTVTDLQSLLYRNSDPRNHWKL
jgi:positive regulator of sigma E activity